VSRECNFAGGHQDSLALGGLLSHGDKAARGRSLVGLETALGSVRDHRPAMWSTARSALTVHCAREWAEALEGHDWGGFAGFLLGCIILSGLIGCCAIRPVRGRG
jgi:hypothetical protein